MPERRIVAALAASTGVTALVSSRIRPVDLLESDTLPALVYRRTGTELDNHSTGAGDFQFTSIEIACLADEYDDAEKLSLAVQDVLSGWASSTGTPAVDMCHLEGVVDQPEAIEAGRDVLTHRIVQIYNVQHRST